MKLNEIITNLFIDLFDIYFIFLYIYNTTRMPHQKKKRAWLLCKL